jgi:hypothetical protein
MNIRLSLESSVLGQPGDEFSFTANPTPVIGSQYHIVVTDADPDRLIIGVYGPDNPTLGKARNKYGLNYVDRTLPKGQYRITVEGPTSPYHITITRNPWWKKIFGVS